MRKKLLAGGFVFTLFLLASAATNFAKPAQANPYMYYEWGYPPKDSIPLEISVSSPKNNSVYRTKEIDFSFNISTNNTSIHYLLEAYFKPDWMTDNITVFKQHPINTLFPDFWNHTETFRDMPDGKYSIVISARGGGGYARGLTYNFFQMTTTCVINFEVEATSPKVSILSPKNKTYDLSEIQLNFTLNEKPSLIRYSLDGQKKSTLYGNNTITNLSNGEHNLTVYVWDDAGNLNISETVVFSIIEPQSETFPIIAVTIASATLLPVVGIGLLVYFKKHRRGKAP